MLKWLSRHIWKRTKVIESNLHRINLRDDPSYPYRVEIERQWPEFHRLPMILMYGGS